MNLSNIHISISGNVRIIGLSIVDKSHRLSSRPE